MLNQVAIMAFCSNKRTMWPFRNWSERLSLEDWGNFSESWVLPTTVTIQPCISSYWFTKLLYCHQERSFGDILQKFDPNLRFYHRYCISFNKSLSQKLVIFVVPLRLCCGKIAKFCYKQFPCKNNETFSYKNAIYFIFFHITQWSYT